MHRAAMVDMKETQNVLKATPDAPISNTTPQATKVSRVQVDFETPPRKLRRIDSMATAGDSPNTTVSTGSPAASNTTSVCDSTSPVSSGRRGPSTTGFSPTLTSRCDSVETSPVKSAAASSSVRGPPTIGWSPTSWSWKSECDMSGFELQHARCTTSLGHKAGVSGCPHPCSCPLQG